MEWQRGKSETSGGETPALSVVRWNNGLVDKVFETGGLTCCGMLIELIGFIMPWILLFCY